MMSTVHILQECKFYTLSNKWIILDTIPLLTVVLQTTALKATMY
jgi:hypothetical protein